MAGVVVGIIGFGTVGAGVYEILVKNREVIADRAGTKVHVKRIADLDLLSDRGVPVDRDLLTRDAMEIVEDPEIQIVVELIGGLDRAGEFLLQAMARGKHVVTANKALLAERGAEIYAAAKRHGVGLGFEASVGGGIPIIGALRGGLAANRIREIRGILNGTSNYILTRMTREGLSYPEVVEDAVRLGYAEDPPTLDVNGTDAAHKLAVLLSLSEGRPFPFQGIYREGIDALTPDDIQFATEFGYRVKLLAVARDLGESLEARVHPAMIPADHILANVNGVYNAIHVEGDFVGPTLFYGLGAGRRPAASAVVADILELARQIRSGAGPVTDPLVGSRGGREALRIRAIEEHTGAYYFRFSALDRPGVLSVVAGILGSHEISIASCIQKGRETNGPVTIVMLTHEAREAGVRQAVSAIDRLEVITSRTQILRVEKGHGAEG